MELKIIYWSLKYFMHFEHHFLVALQVSLYTRKYAI
jgi:hypothetical protein